MPRYRYTATTSDGSPRSGLVMANDEKAAFDQLVGESLQAVLLAPAVDRGEGRLSAETAEALARAIAGAEASGVPLPDLLAATAEDLADSRLVGVARQLAQLTRQGVPLDEAIDSIAERLPNGIRGVLTAGVKTGRIADVLESYGQQQVVRKEIMHMIWSTLVYPLLIVAVFIPIMLLFALWIVPMFGQMFQEFGVSLPAMTISVLELSKQLPFLLVVLLGVPMGVVVIIKLFRLKRLDHRLRNATPVIGRMWTWAGQAELASMLATFLENRIPLPDALEQTAATVHDENAAHACRWASGQVRSGRSLGAAFADSMHVDPMLAKLAGWGESALPDKLHLAADVFQARITRRAAFLTRVLPVLSLFMIGGFMVGIVIVSLFLPLIGLITELSG